MKLLEVYTYRNTGIHKFIYEYINNGYLWLNESELIRSASPIIDDNCTKVVRKDI